MSNDDTGGQPSVAALVQLIAYVEGEARQVSTTAAYCLAIARLELDKIAKTAEPAAKPDAPDELDILH